MTLKTQLAGAHAEIHNNAGVGAVEVKVVEHLDHAPRQDLTVQQAAPSALGLLNVLAVDAQVAYSSIRVIDCMHVVKILCDGGALAACHVRSTRGVRGRAQTQPSI
jgi:hypothetical protein